MNEALNPLRMERDATPGGTDAGDSAASESPPGDFAALYQQYYPRVFGYVMRTLLNRQAAEDVTSEAFFRALRNFSNYEPRRGSFSSWIYRIATNAMRDYFRSHRNLVSLDSGGDAVEQLASQCNPAAGAAERMAQLEDREALHREIVRLRPIYRIVITLHYFEERSIREIAEILGSFAPTVRWRLHQARRQLARQLNRAGRDSQ